MMAPICLVCAARETRPLDAPSRWRCRACGFVFVDPVDGTLGAGYDTTCAGGTADAIDEGRRPLYAKLLGEVPPSGGRRCLDVGSGGGLFVRLAAAAGWDAVGVDPAGPEKADSRCRLMRIEFLVVSDGRYLTRSQKSEDRSQNWLF